MHCCLISQATCLRLTGEGGDRERVRGEGGGEWEGVQEI